MRVRCKPLLDGALRTITLSKLLWSETEATSYMQSARRRKSFGENKRVDFERHLPPCLTTQRVKLSLNQRGICEGTSNHREEGVRLF